MLIHTPDGEIRLHQIITHFRISRRKSQKSEHNNIKTARRIDSRSHYYLHTAAPFTAFFFLLRLRIKKLPVLFSIKFSSVSHVAGAMVIFMLV